MRQKDLKEYLDYNKKTGVFKWRKKIADKITVGQTAGCKTSNGYILIRVKGILYKGHRLAWLYVYGKNPKHDIDHINHNRADNRISNLRDVRQKTNSRNSKLKKNNKSGFNGVCWDKRRDKWRANIMTNKKYKHIGYYKTKEAAIQARIAENKKVGYHKNHGINN